ncbi:MAG: Hsp70 family protein, partial [Myxococcota bacterium]
PGLSVSEVLDAFDHNSTVRAPVVPVGKPPPIPQRPPRSQPNAPPPPPPPVPAVPIAATQVLQVPGTPTSEPTHPEYAASIPTTPLGTTPSPEVSSWAPPAPAPSLPKGPAVNPAFAPPPPPQPPMQPPAQPPPASTYGHPSGVPAGPPGTTHPSWAPVPPGLPPAGASPPPPGHARVVHQSSIPPMPDAPLLLDVTPHSLGVETVGGFCEHVIVRNAAIPVEHTRIFSTAQDNQESVRVRICQGESRVLHDNQGLGEVELRGLRRGRRGEIKIGVTFELSADGTLGVRAEDLGTGVEQTIRIRLVGGVSEGEIEAMKARQAALLGAR